MNLNNKKKVYCKIYFLWVDYVNNYSKCKIKINDIIVNIFCYDCIKLCVENVKVIE